METEQKINENNVVEAMENVVKTVKSQRLTIRVSRYAMSFSVPDAENAGQIEYVPYPMKSGVSTAANLREAFLEEPLLQREWKKALVMVSTPVVIVPADSFRAGTETTIYNHAVLEHEGDLVMFSVLTQLNAVALFAVNRDLKTVIDDHFEDAKWCPVCQPVWNYMHQRSYAGMRRKLYAYFYDKHLALFSFAENRFRFVNTFDGTNRHDSVYFILSVWKQLALDQKRDELHLVGNIPEREEMMEQLHKFLQNVYRINPSGDFNRAPITQIKGLPYDLMTLYLKGRG